MVGNSSCHRHVQSSLCATVELLLIATLIFIVTVYLCSELSNAVCIVCICMVSNRARVYTICVSLNIN